MNSMIKKAYDFIIAQCNDPLVGYSQEPRDGKWYNGKRYYDCSSLIYYALEYAGFDVGETEIYTAIQRKWLKNLGFTEYPASIQWKSGDILWRKGHTEMVYKDNFTMGAHTYKYEFDRQVSINPYETDNSEWTYLYRYEKDDSFTSHIMRRFIKCL